MLGSFVRHGLSQPEAESESLLQMYAYTCRLLLRLLTPIPSVAGSETTATAIRATLLHVVTNPQVYNKLVTEITTAARDLNLPTPVPDSAAKTLSYLQAVIKEGLRIWPPITGLMSKVVPPGGDTYRGMEIPAGTVIGYSAFGLSRNKEVWGDDADVFRPERWLEGTREEMRAKEAAVDLVFGHGRWLCLGKNVAFVELNKVLFEVSGPNLLTGLVPVESCYSCRIVFMLMGDRCYGTLIFPLPILPRYVTLFLALSRREVPHVSASSC